MSCLKHRGYCHIYHTWHEFAFFDIFSDIATQWNLTVTIVMASDVTILRTYHSFTLVWLTQWSRVLLYTLIVIQLLKQSECLLLGSQYPAVDSYFGPDEGSPQLQMLFKLQFNIILSSTSMFYKWSLSYRICD